MSDEKPRLEINWVQSAAGALAAVTSAVLLSTVGVAGTLIGAALGSLAATIGSAVYSYYIRTTKERVLVQAVAAARVGLAQRKVQEAAASPDEPVVEEQLAEAEEDLARAREVLEETDPEPATGGWRAVLAGLPWKRIAVLATAVFVVAMLVILAFELLTGRAVSSYTGGSDDRQRTSIPWNTRTTDDGDSEQQQEAPADEATPTESDEEDLLVPETEPTTETTPTPTDTATAEPTPTTESTPTPTPAEPTPVPEETAAPTP